MNEPGENASSDSFREPADNDHGATQTLTAGTEFADQPSAEPLSRDEYADYMRQGPAADIGDDASDGHNTGHTDDPGDGDDSRWTDPAEQAQGMARGEYADYVQQGPAAEGDDDGSANAERPDMAARYPADYIPAPDSPPHVEGPHERPDGWAGEINPDRHAPGRDNNCGECSRAVNSTWDGKPAVAAAMSDPDAPGEPVDRMTDWAGQASATASMSEIQQRLGDLGPGSSAVVGCDWKHGGGHWFNAINDKGTVKAVDGQSGNVETWPPSARGLGFDETDMRYSDAIFFTADGKVAEK